MGITKGYLHLGFSLYLAVGPHIRFNALGGVEENKHGVQRR